MFSKKYQLLYEDSDLIIVNKGPNLISRDDPNSLEALLGYSLAHRLDKQTTGLMIAAKNEWSLNRLLQDFKRRNITKLYQLVVPISRHLLSSGVVNLSLKRNHSNRKMQSFPGGKKEAITYYRVLQKGPKYALVECNIRTGRTHQIRVHMSTLGCPILGDVLYGPKNNIPELMLHASQIEFQHPTSKQMMAFKSDWWSTKIPYLKSYIA